MHSSYSTTFTQNQQLRKLLKSTDTSYERLEFLGDTILEMIVTEYLFAANPSADEGFLTQRRISLVSNSVCSSVSTFLGLPSFILHRVSSLSLKMKADVFESTLAALYMTFGKELTSHFLIHSFMLFANSSTPTIN
uniref:RNase III domain-containing protein n=1 Tax=Arcella intermedia TaxID=1963864 RepID=A0A6B2LP01_9EUKA